MEQKLCRLLDHKATELAEMYSDPERAKKNTGGVLFEVEKVTVCSDLTGAVTLKKSNGQRCLIWCYWIAMNTRDGNGGEFRWLTVRYDHLYGMSRLIQLMAQIEQKNYESNTAPVTL